MNQAETRNPSEPGLYSYAVEGEFLKVSDSDMLHSCPFENPLRLHTFIAVALRKHTTPSTSNQQKQQQ